ncbi:MAG: hypothetical protein II844_00850 [Prevotella sp.]|nr:hypothetical protein [Prevotella sp.]
MKKILNIMVLLLFVITAAKADVLGEYSFTGTLGGSVPVKLKFCVNGDQIAVGEIYYPKAKHPAPILVVGRADDDGHYFLREFQSDGTVTGYMMFDIADENTPAEHIVEGMWINPRTGKELRMTKMYADNEFVDVPKYLDYEDPQNIGREYAYKIWNENYKSMMGGSVEFKAAGKYKLHFKVSNCPQNIAEGESEPNRPAVLGESTHDYFNYDNVNECGYSFSAHFFKKFVVLKSTSDYDTYGCFGMGATFDGVYIKVKQ